MVAGWQFSGSIEPNFIEDTGKNDDAMGLLTRAADWEGHVRHAAPSGRGDNLKLAPN